MSTRKRSDIPEVVGDYSMAGSVRYAAPGNIRADMLVKGYRGNVLSDERAEEEAAAQELGLEEESLREYVRQIVLDLL